MIKQSFTLLIYLLSWHSATSPPDDITHRLGFDHSKTTNAAKEKNVSFLYFSILISKQNHLYNVKKKRKKLDKSVKSKTSQRSKLCGLAPVTFRCLIIHDRECACVSKTEFLPGLARWERKGTCQIVRHQESWLDLHHNR